MNSTSKKTAIACALMMFGFAGLTTNGFAAYQPLLLSVKGFTNTQGSIILTVRNISSLLAMLMGNKIYRKISIRKGVALAGFCAGMGFILFSATQTFYGCCAAGFILGISFGAGGMIPLAIIASRCFGEKKTKIMGICAAMTGLSTMGIPFLIVSVADKYGLPFMFRAEGIFELILMCLVYILMQDGLAQEAQNIDNRQEPKEPSGYSPLSSREIVLFFCVAVFAGAPGLAGVTHLSVLCTGEGLSPQTAAAAVMISGISLTVSKALYGTVKEKIGPYCSQILYGVLLVSGQILFSAIGKSTVILYVSVVLYSSGLTFLTVGLADWADTLAPANKRELLIQISQTGYMVGGLLLSSLPGMIADCNGGSYIKAYIVFAVLSFLTVSLNYIESRRHKRK